MQQVLLGRELVKHGIEVLFVTGDYGQPAIEKIDGITVLRSYPAGAGKGVTPVKIRLLWQAMKKADADIYYQRSGVSGIVALFCWAHRKRFVYAVANDEIVDPRRSAPLADKWLKRLDFRLADTIVTQKQSQQSSLRANFNRESMAINSICPVSNQPSQKAAPAEVLWVGNIRPEKRPELFLRLAKALPQYRFIMIGGPAKGAESLYEKVRKEAEVFKNLDFRGPVPYAEIGGYFDRASVLVNTSTAEGFSNTFLQAWERWTPVITLDADPDEIICRLNLGLHSRSFDKLVKDLEQLLISNTLRFEMGQRGRDYIISEHSPHKISEKYRILFKDLINRFETTPPEVR